ncbi:MAG: T9SS type A sorting domain-containing protein [Bacteroidetes bacterium]|nr:T9SS type A sorting domain-containing protein [Bacteroidota bacterium]
MSLDTMVVTLIMACKISSNGDRHRKVESRIQTLFPNPVKNILFFNPIPTETTINIYSVLGEKLRTYNIFGSTNSIDISELSSGVYFLKYENNKVVRFVKE